MTTEYVAKLFRDRYNASCIPVTAEKAPLVKWSLYRDRRPTDAEISRWFAGNNSIAVVAGNVQCIDFDEKYSPNIFEKFSKRCEDNMVDMARYSLLCQKNSERRLPSCFLVRARREKPKACRNRKRKCRN